MDSRPDGKKKAYVRLAADHDALDVANKVMLLLSRGDSDALTRCCRLVSSKPTFGGGVVVVNSDYPMSHMFMCNGKAYVVKLICFYDHRRS